MSYNKTSVCIPVIFSIFFVFLFLSMSSGAGVIPDVKNGSSELLTLQFNRQRGYYTSGFNLEISSNKTAKIYYTTDGSTPTAAKGKPYSSPLRIDSTTIVKAIAIAEPEKSEIVTQSYFFVDAILRQPKHPNGFPVVWGGSSVIPADYEMDPVVVKNPAYSATIREAFQSIPTLSLSMSIDDWFDPSGGLYVGYPNTDVTREKAVTAEFIFPETGSNFMISCGLQNQGGTSIVNWKVPKQSSRLLFKEIYGPARLKYKLFDDSEIKSINTLVADAFLYGWVHPFDSIQRNTSLFFRDQLCSDLQNSMGWLSFHGKYINLFINGLYWGMYDLHERPDEAFMSEYFEEPEAEFEILKHNPNDIVQGTNVFYNQMLEQARKGFASNENLRQIRKYLELEPFIDYMILNFYLGNFDWAHQNYYVSRNAAQNGAFRYYTWDAEHVMRYTDVNYNNTLKNDKGGPTEIHTLLKQNEEYRVMFADEVYKHCFNNGTLTPDNFRIGFMKRKAEMDKAVVLESARWGDYLEKTSGRTYTKNDHWLPEVNKALSEYIPNRRDIFISQLRSSSNKLFPTVMPPVFQETANQSGTTIALTNPNAVVGDIFFTTDGSDPRMTGGKSQGKTYINPIEIKTNTVVKARFKSKNTGEWSALATRILTFGSMYGNGLAINEIMYDPESDFPEFVEIENSSPDFIDLQDFEISDGISYRFQRGAVLYPGQALVLTSDSALFRQMYHLGSFGQFSKKLDNKGETLILKNCFKQVIDSVSFKDTIPWPRIPEPGFSIELKESRLDNSLAENWKRSSLKNGTPFKPDTKMDLPVNVFPNPFGNKLTIELNSVGINTGKIGIELYNITGTLITKTEMTNSQSKTEFYLQYLQKGVYLLKLYPLEGSAFDSKTFKVLKIN